MLIQGVLGRIADLETSLTFLAHLHYLSLFSLQVILFSLVGMLFFWAYVGPTS